MYAFLRSTSNRNLSANSERSGVAPTSDQLRLLADGLASVAPALLDAPVLWPNHEAKQAWSSANPARRSHPGSAGRCALATSWVQVQGARSIHRSGRTDRVGLFEAPAPVACGWPRKRIKLGFCEEARRVRRVARSRVRLACLPPNRRLRPRRGTRTFPELAANHGNGEDPET